MNPFCTAILVAAGSSRRMGFDKLSALLCGKPVLVKTIEAFFSAKMVSSIIIVCPEERRMLFENMVFSKPVTFVNGGENRQDSVANGLASCDPNTQFIAIHDGARPLISPEDINQSIEAAKIYQSVSLAKRATETMKRADADAFCIESVDRENLWCMETPQVFSASLLKKAYQIISEKKLIVTDEVSAIQAIGENVKFIESRFPNIKITTPADLILVEAILKSSIE